MTKPDINQLLTAIKAAIETVATGWQIELAPERINDFLITSDKGVVFVGFRGIFLEESMSPHHVIQNGDMQVQISIVANAVYGDNGALALMSDLVGALTACVFDSNRGEKCYINQAELVERDEKRARWVYAVSLIVPIYLSE